MYRCIVSYLELNVGNLEFCIWEMVKSIYGIRCIWDKIMKNWNFISELCYVLVITRYFVVE